MRLLVVSDLHILGPDDPVYLSLLDLLRHRTHPGDEVVLAGDIFDLFVGSKAVFRDRYEGFFSTLKEAGARGVNLHYIEGNHDFLLRKAFAEIPRFHLYPHEVKLELAGKRFFVAHGDTVDRSDYGYRALRVLFRSPLMKTLVKVTPGKVLDSIGKRSSEASRGSRPRMLAELPLDRAEALRRRFRSYAAEKLAQGYDYVVLGHCHDLDEMRFKVGDRQGQYVNVGFPRVHGSFLSWEPGEALISREAMPTGNSLKSKDNRATP